MCIVNRSVVEAAFMEVFPSGSLPKRGRDSSATGYIVHLANEDVCIRCVVIRVSFAP